jgi:type II secretory pathway component GspD/PulD (secretin)/tetratricopeptide (TPR) repeat protein
MAVGIALATAGFGAQAPALPETEQGNDPAQTRPSRIHVALRSAADCYRRRDYELAATYLQQAQAGQNDLTPAERHELTSFLELNNTALRARREGAEQVRQAEQAAREGRTHDALAALRALTHSQEFLAPADRTRVQQLTEQLTGGGDQDKPTGTRTPASQALARSKLKQARVLLLKGNHDAALALAEEADRLGVNYLGADDTPQKVIADINTARAIAATPNDPKSLLIAARAALASGQLDQAEALAKQADKVGSVWSSVSHLWSDSPSKVLKDVQNARAKQPSKQETVANASKDTATTFDSLKPLVRKNDSSVPNASDVPRSSVDNTETARQIVQQARKAIQEGNLAKAKQLTNQARALKPELNWWEDTPDKLVADIRQAEGIKQTGAIKETADVEDKSIDPRALVKQARASLDAGKLEEAQQLASRASVTKSVRWGLFEDSPDKLLLDIRKAKYKHDQEESVHVLAEGRKQLEQGNWAEAERLAHRAERLHGPYSLWDMGDRPQKLLAQIETAKSKENKPKLPPLPADLVKKDPEKPAAKKDGLPPPSWPKAPEQSTDLTSQRANKTPYASRPVDGFPDGSAASSRDGGIRAPERNNSPAAPAPQATVSRTSPDKGRAQALLVEARQLQKDGRLLEARQKAEEAQKIRAYFGPEEDRPEAVLVALAVLCQKRIDSLVQQASDYAAAGSVDPARFQQAEQALIQARQLAVGFRLDTHMIDSRLAAVQQMQSGVQQSKSRTPSITQAKHQEMMTPAGEMQQHGKHLLNQARMEIRAGQTVTARRLAEQAYSGPYGVQEEAAQVLRSIDTEEFQQKLLTANRTFEAGLLAFQRREYSRAATIFRQIDPQLLTPDKQSRLREIMLAPEMQPTALIPVAHKDQASLPGRAHVTDTVPDGSTGMTRSHPAEGDYAQQVKALQEVQFQKLRVDGLQIQTDARKRFEAGDTDRALEMLQEYIAGLANSGLDSEKQAMLRKSAEARLQQLTQLKHQREFEKLQASQQASAQQEHKRLALAEDAKKKQIAELMKQFNTLYKEGKYAEAEVAAMKAHDLDPDNAIAGAAIAMVRTQMNQVKSQSNKEQKEKYFVDAMGDAETEGPPVNSDNPIFLDPVRTAQTKNRKPLDLLKELNSPKSEKEREIYRRLDGPISNMDFKDTPLRQILDDLQSYTGVNIVPDVPALEEEGISLDQPVTMRLLDGIWLKSALNLLLHQVHLTYVVKDQVLFITTEKNARGKLVTKIHGVLDLVIPVSNSTDSSSVWKALGHSGDASNLKLNGSSPYLASTSLAGGSAVSQQSSMSTVPGTMSTVPGGSSGMSTVTREDPKVPLHENLIRLITNTIAPQSWDNVGGHGHIEFFPLGMALVINQTPDIQEQVAELLNALRRLQDQEVAVEIRFITIAESFFEKIGLDFNINIRTDNSKFEPQIVSQQFRPFGFINHFTPKNFVSGLTPAGSLTQDLNIPISNSSFQFAVPPFGQFPNIPGGNGGLSMGLAFLSDIEVFLFMEAAQGDSRTNVMQAPKITLFNGQTSTITVNDQQFFVTAVSVTQVGGQVVFTPNNQEFVTGGVTVTLDAVISADRRFVRLSLNPTITNLASAQVQLFPITTFITPVFEGGFTGQPVPFTQFLQQPAFNTITVRTTVNVPDGGTVLLGGLKRLSEGRSEFGTPILSKIPYLSRLFRNVGYGRDTESLLMMVTPRIIINEEEEQKLLGAAPPTGGLP